MPARYRVGIIACGLIAEAHLRAYRKIPAVEVVAGADVSPEVRERWQAEHGVRRMYAGAAEMLERERPHLVSICTWPPLRPEMTELACARGVKGIVAEKPMAVDLAGCDRMIAAAQRSGTALIVGHQRRFHNRYVKARELIDSGAIGDVAQISVFVSGDLLTSATHMVDVIRFLLHDAPAEWVIGQIDRRDPGFTNRPLGLQQWEETHMRYGHHVEAGALGLIQFQGGARGLVEVGIVSRPRPGYSATVYGTDGIIGASGDRPEPGEPSTGGRPEPWLRARVKGEPDWTYPAVEPNDAIQAEIEALIDVLERGGTHPLDGRSARQGHEILMAIYESARRRARVDLPLAVAENPLEAMVAAGEL
jgi:predicted dehydrogenase